MRLSYIFQFYLPSIVQKKKIFYSVIPCSFPHGRVCGGEKSFQEVIPILPCKFCRSIQSCQIRRSPRFYAKQFYFPKSRDSYDVGVGCTAFGAAGHGRSRPFMPSPGDPGPGASGKSEPPPRRKSAFSGQVTYGILSTVGQIRIYGTNPWRMMPYIFSELQGIGVATSRYIRH